MKVFNKVKALKLPPGWGKVGILAKMKRPLGMLFTALLGLGLSLIAGLALEGCSHKMRDTKVLIFSRTLGYRHESIGVAKVAVMKMLAEKNIRADTTEDANKFTEENLKTYSAIIFLSTTGDVLNVTQQAVMERFIQAGGGFVGIHAAADTEYGWPWYGKLVGAYFDSHPKPQDAMLRLTADTDNALFEGLPKDWKHFDEWYNFRPLSLDTTSATTVLYNIDEKTYEGGKNEVNGKKHPITWYHDYDGGRAFYTAMGHTDACYKDALFMRQLMAGITYAIGDNSKNYSNAYSNVPPDQNRFTRKVIASNLDEPTELAIDADGNVFVVTRKGGVMRMDAKTQKLTTIHKIDVWTIHEDGLLGITLDPNFSKNHWLYLFFSPNKGVSEQNLSRFTYTEDGKLEDEKVLLRVPTQRDECCHTGGSMTFDKDGNLFVSLGDNTNPFKSTGYAPIDEREGRSAFDAQKSSANTMDLRGKILRIKPTADGSYSIPDGNLFGKDGKVGRPEIYVMGCRNPYRISVDKLTGVLYWGDVGPDGGKDSTIGPKGYDEFNMTSKPGNFGWPYFIGQNYAYAEYDFGSQAVGQRYNVNAPVNNSPNNYGAKVLPPAQPALIWYPYMESEYFPELEKGGRCAMAGPTYHFDPNLASDVKLPKYYDGVVIAYDWMRNWFMAVRPSANGKTATMERMFTGMPLNRVIDMELGPDGAMYMVEYGTFWFAQNDDARLVKIEYSNDNRKPIVKASTSVNSGGLPLTVQFSSAGTVDYDAGDSLTYQWHISNPSTINATEKNPSYTFTKPGVYRVFLLVTDRKGQSSVAETQVVAGNERPKVKLDLVGNQSFYFDNESVKYRASVTDGEDGSSDKGTIDPGKIYVFNDYLAQGEDVTEIAQGHQANKAAGAGMVGEALIAKSDCKACHQPLKYSVGPSWVDISNRYGGTTANGATIEKLGKKIISGGAGNWGDHGMSAHPQIPLVDTKKMVEYIMVAGQPAKPDAALAAVGTATFKQHKANEESGVYIITAKYRDRGANGLPPAETQVVRILRFPKISPFDCAYFNGFKKKIGTGGHYAECKNNNGYCSWPNVDLTGITNVTVDYAAEQDGYLELKADTVTGAVLGRVLCKSSEGWDKFITVNMPVKMPVGIHKLVMQWSSTTSVDDKVKINVRYLKFRKGGGGYMAQR